MSQQNVRPKFKDRTDDPENCPQCGSKLKFAHMVPAGFGPEHPEFQCTGCGTYYTNPFLDTDAKLKPENYRYFAVHNISNQSESKQT